MPSLSRPLRPWDFYGLALQVQVSGEGDLFVQRHVGIALGQRAKLQEMGRQWKGGWLVIQPVEYYPRMRPLPVASGQRRLQLHVIASPPYDGQGTMQRYISLSITFSSRAYERWLERSDVGAIQATHNRSFSCMACHQWPNAWSYLIKAAHIVGNCPIKYAHIGSQVA